MLQNIAIITCLFDYPDSYYPLFFNQAIKYFDIKDIFIARFNKDKEIESYYDKLCYYKINKLYNFLKTHIKNRYKYILFLDATDTNFYSSPESIIQVFEKKNNSIVFGAEKCLWPSTKYDELYNTKQLLSSEYRYLNSGTYFGYTDSILYHLSNIIDRNMQGYDDQGQWTVEYLLNNDISIDQECDLFFSTLNSKNYIDLNTYKIHTYNPIIVHDNGPFNEQTIKIANKI